MDDMKQILAAWVRDARKTAGLSQEELGARLAIELGEERGYTKANISGWETQRHSPSLRQLAAIARVTGCGIHHPILDALSADETARQAAVSMPGSMRVRVGEDPNAVPIRYIKLKLHAGITGFESEADMDVEETLPMPRGAILALEVDPAFLLVAEIKGCSMEPMMFEGDKVVINTADRRPVSRELYAVNFDGEGCVKQLLHRGGQWYLHSLNPDFGPINMRSGDCQIVGRVVYQPGRIITGRL